MKSTTGHKSTRKMASRLTNDHDAGRCQIVSANSFRGLGKKMCAALRSGRIGLWQCMDIIIFFTSGSNYSLLIKVPLQIGRFGQSYFKHNIRATIQSLNFMSVSTKPVGQVMVAIRWRKPASNIQRVIFGVINCGCLTQFLLIKNQYSRNAHLSIWVNGLSARCGGRLESCWAQEVVAARRNCEGFV